MVNTITFTVMPAQEALREHISENCEDYGWNDSLSLEFESWLDKICKEQTENNLRYYATNMPEDGDFGVFDKYLEKSYEEQTGWLCELREGLPENVKDDEEVIVLKYDDEIHWTDMQLGVITSVITPKCNKV